MAQHGRVLEQATAQRMGFESGSKDRAAKFNTASHKMGAKCKHDLDQLELCDVTARRSVWRAMYWSQKRPEERGWHLGGNNNSDIAEHGSKWAQEQKDDTQNRSATQ